MRLPLSLVFRSRVMIVFFLYDMQNFFSFLRCNRKLLVVANNHIIRK